MDGESSGRSRTNMTIWTDLSIWLQLTSTLSIENFSKQYNTVSFHFICIFFYDRSRLCMLLRIIGRFSCYALQNVWSKEMKESLEALANDVDENVQQV